jgi:hypothetical protein
MWTASAHIITAVIGSGVLSLGWAIAQLGWVAGPVVMLLFSLVTYYTSSLLADCYRSGDPSTGKRNYTYMDAVNANLSACPSAFVPLLLNVSALRELEIRQLELTLCIPWTGISSSRWHQGPDLRVPAVRQHRGRGHRLHHRRLHQHAVSERSLSSGQ